MKMTDDMGIIYQRYSGDLYRFCMSMCNNKDLAEDMCHETFYKALKSANILRDVMYVSSYFRTQEQI